MVIINSRLEIATRKAIRYRLPFLKSVTTINDGVKIMTCDHVGHRVYAVRVFQNLTEHFCVQCLNCGAIVRQNNKLWLKAEDIPQNKAIHVFDEVLHEKGLRSL